MPRTILLFFVFFSAHPAEPIWAGDPAFSDPAKAPSPPADAIGYPSRSPDLDALPGFRNPPPGYGEVPFWWWTGDTLDADRMIAQLKQLHAKGISGVQVNYSHYDTPGWLTEHDPPAIFSDVWWQVYSRISETASRLDMGIGLSTYTLDWPRGARNLFYHLFYSKPGWNAIQLETGPRHRLRQGETKTIAFPESTFLVRAYPIKDGKPARGGLDLSPHLKNGRLTWTAPQGDWAVWSFRTVRKSGSLNPLMTGAGEVVIRGFFQPFQDRNAGGTSKGLNYFFNDELHIGLGKFAWNPDFSDEFLGRKGYSLLDVLPAMWTDMGAVTPKVRMDYADVRMQLMEERYFKPIYAWHASRGMIFACDSGGRGRNPHEFGDYVRATRWYTAPGHDTPGGRADLIKGKVSSSIANLYRRPRVWLEGYHSLGWGATPEQLMFATRENYLYGCTLLNLHGLYYSTYGSHWEWAPPCYHFRMPYWAHMDVFLRYFDRLSYLFSQGHFVCDVAVVYPVAPYEAEMNGNRARNTAFDLGERLLRGGINFEFIDHDSLARAEVADNKLCVKAASAEYQALVFPAMGAVHWSSIEKAAAFAQAGGRVYGIGDLPAASDRAGRDDPELAAMNALAFKPERRLKSTGHAVQAIRNAFIQDVQGHNRTVRTHHRRIGPRDVYMVMDAGPGTEVTFRAHGAASLWDPWTGNVRPLRIIEKTAAGTRVVLPLAAYEAQVVVFTPNERHVNPPQEEKGPLRQIILPDAWTVGFVPTMDNAYGDFRLPVTGENKTIGLEARRFAWARETDALKTTAMRPDCETSGWPTKLHGYGTQFHVLGPIPDAVEAADADQLESDLAGRKQLDPASPVTAGGKTIAWRPYDFSWRYGKEGDLGHQGYHGLKRTVTDDFICLGKPARGLNETRYVDPPSGKRFFLWTTVTLPTDQKVNIIASTGPPADKSHTSPVLIPAAVYINGARITDFNKPVSLKAGTNPVLIRYDHAGRGHFVIRRLGSPPPEKRTPLSMQWYDDPGIIPFDVHAGRRRAEWFRFLSAPGSRAIRVGALGTVQAWLDGIAMQDKGNGQYEAFKPPEHAAVVALRIMPPEGLTGGAVIPEPITVSTSGKGVMPLGDWSKMGILNNYSGGVRYSTAVTLSEDQAREQVTLDLGRVAATAEVRINGRKAGIRVAPPWQLAVGGLFKAGRNEVSILVFNTLANHYQTIPSRYRGQPTSGLFGPVRLLSRSRQTGETAPGQQGGIKN